MPKALHTIRSMILLSGIWLLSGAMAHTQLGADIDGEAAADNFGSSVSLSANGSRLAIGAWLNDGNGKDSGHVRVYQWSGSAWQQLGADIDGEAEGDRLGYSVTLSADGNRLAVGAYLNEGNGPGSGHVRVYQWSGSAWQQLGADIDGKAANDNFGVSISLSADGNRLAAGAWFNDDNGIDSGKVRVYQWSGSDWLQFGMDIDGEAARDRTGFPVSLSTDGSRLVIGASTNDGNGENSGHVRVFQWSGSAWQQLGGDIDGEAAYDSFGISVAQSADGNRLAIGADLNDGNGTDSGHVRVFQWSGSAWQQLGADIAGAAEGDRFGRAVSISSDGNRLAIGAWFNDGNGPDSGQARIYQWSDSAWQQIGADIDGEAADDHFGLPVSLSSDGNRLAIGASTNDGNGSGSGHVRVFSVDSGPVKFSIGGSVFGLAGSGLVLQNNNGDNLAVNANRVFTFATGLENGAVYDVSILNQPVEPGQECTLINNSGTIVSANVTNVGLNCITPEIIMGGCAGSFDEPGCGLDEN